MEAKKSEFVSSIVTIGTTKYILMPKKQIDIEFTVNDMFKVTIEKIE